MAPYWRDHFDKEIDWATQRGDHFALEVLSDHWVTDEEWQATQDHFHDCMGGYGLIGHLSIIGESVGAGLDPAEQARIREGLDEDAAERAELRAYDRVTECTDSTVLGIGLMYAGPRANPGGVGFEESVRRCFKSIGRDDLVVMTDEEISALLDDDTLLGEDAEATECVWYPTYDD